MEKIEISQVTGNGEYCWRVRLSIGDNHVDFYHASREAAQHRVGELAERMERRNGTASR